MDILVTHVSPEVNETPFVLASTYAYIHFLRSLLNLRHSSKPGKRAVKSLKAYPTDLLASTSPVSLVICGAPYKQVPSSNFKGSSELQDVGGNASTKKWSAAR